MSRAEFCRGEGICYGSFLGWIAQWAQQEDKTPEFVEVVEAMSGASHPPPAKPALWR